MFQFTREFIINDLNGKLLVDNDNVSVPKGTLGATKSKIALDKLQNPDLMYIDNMINLRKKDIHAIYKNPHQKAKNEEVKLAIPSSYQPNAGDLLRIVVTLGQEGRVISTYNDQYPDHSRQLFYEAVVETPATGSAIFPASKFNKVMTKDAESTYGAFATVEVNGTDIVVSATDEYTRVKEIKLEKVNVAPLSQTGASLTGYTDYTVLANFNREEKADRTMITKRGQVGVGTTNYIVHNMRLQTAANLNPYGTQMDERPIPGAAYDQYTVELVTERRHIGHSVVGPIDHSLTTVIFFVLADRGDDNCKPTVSDTFYDFLSKFCEIKMAVDTEIAVDVDDKNNKKVKEDYDMSNTDVIESTVITKDSKGTTAEKNKTSTEEIP